jgi:hypothetical protein
MLLSITPSVPIDFIGFNDNSAVELRQGFGLA